MRREGAPGPRSGEALGRADQGLQPGFAQDVRAIDAEHPVLVAEEVGGDGLRHLGLAGTGRTAHQHREHRLTAPRLRHAPVDAARELTRHEILADDAAAEKGGHFVRIYRGGRARRSHCTVDAWYLGRRAIEHP